MESSVIELVTVFFVLTIILLGVLNIIDKDVAKDLLSIVSILITILFSYRRRGEVRKLASFLRKIQRSVARS